MKKNTLSKRHLDFYKKAMETGDLLTNPFSEWKNSGLCGVANAGLISYLLLYLFQPTEEDTQQLKEEGLGQGWWASEMLRYDTDNYSKQYAFNPLRQTVVLFMAAMNDEL